MVKPTRNPPPEPAQHTSTPPVVERLPETITKPFAVPRKELQRQEAQYQRQRAAVRQRAMVKQRKGR